MSSDLARVGIQVDAAGAIITSDKLGASLDQLAAKEQKLVITAAQSKAAWDRSAGSVSSFNTIISQMKAEWDAANVAAAQSVTAMGAVTTEAKGLAQASTAAGRAMAMQELEAYKMDAAMGASFKGVNRVREAVTSMTASVVQSAPGVAQLTSVLGAQALGGPIMIGVLAGLSAVVFAYRSVTSEAREAAKAQDEAIKSLLEWQKVQNYGAAGKFGNDVAEANKRLSEMRTQLAGIKLTIDATPLGEAGLAQRGAAERSLGARQAEYAKLAKAIEEGEAHVAEIRQKAAEASVSQTVRDTAALIAGHNASANELRNAVTLVASLQAQLYGLTKAGGSAEARAQLIAQIKELNEALHPKPSTEAKAAARDREREFQAAVNARHDTNDRIPHQLPSFMTSEAM